MTSLSPRDRELVAREIDRIADDWQHGEWADAPRRANPQQERIANAQHVTDWLRARAARLRHVDETFEGI